MSVHQITILCSWREYRPKLIYFALRKRKYFALLRRAHGKKPKEGKAYTKIVRSIIIIMLVKSPHSLSL